MAANLLDSSVTEPSVTEPTQQAEPATSSLRPKYPFIQWVSKFNQQYPETDPDQAAQAYIHHYGPPPEEEMVPLETFAEQVKPLNPDASDVDLRVYYDNTFGAAQRARDKLSPQDGERGDFFRGAKEALQQNPQLLHGLSSLVAATGENVFGSGGAFTAWKQSSLKSYQDWEQTLQTSSKETDSLSHSWKEASENGNPVALVDFMQRTAGYVSGQVATVLAVGTAASLLGTPAAGITAAVATATGKGGARGALGGLVQNLIDKEAAKLAASGAAKGMTAEAITKQATISASKKIAATTALAPYETAMETGEIGGDVVKHATNEGRNPSGVEIAKAFAGGMVAGAIGWGEDIVGMKVLRGSSKVNGLLDTAPGKTGRLARAGAQGTVLGAAGGATEYGQTIVEQLGKGEDPTTASAKLEQFDAFGVGAVGGAMLGGAGGAMQSPIETPSASTQQAPGPQPSPSTGLSPMGTPPSFGGSPKENVQREVEKLRAMSQRSRDSKTKADVEVKQIPQRVGVFDSNVDLDAAVTQAEASVDDIDITDILTESMIDQAMDTQGNVDQLQAQRALEATKIIEEAAQAQPIGQGLPPVNLPTTTNSLGAFEGQTVEPQGETIAPNPETIQAEPETLAAEPGAIAQPGETIAQERISPAATPEIPKTSQVETSEVQPMGEATVEAITPKPESVTLSKRQRIAADKAKLKAQSHYEVIDNPTPTDLVKEPRSRLPDEQNAELLTRAYKAKADLGVINEAGPQESLMEALRSKGGVQDQGGEIRQLEVDRENKPFTKNLIQEKGMTLDDAAEFAHEQGFIPERDINLLLDALDQESRQAGPDWYEQVTTGKRKLSPEQVEAALEKIEQDKGKDVGKDVEIVKDAILQDPDFVNSPYAPRSEAESESSRSFVRDEREQGRMEAGGAQAHEYASTQFNLRGADSRAIQSLARRIPDEDLADDGRESSPHVTLKYGIEEDSAVDAVKRLMSQQNTVTAKLGKVSVFPATDSRPSDVVKVDIHSDELTQLNDQVSRHVKTTSTQDAYRPHITIAYVKPGLGEKYAKKFERALEGKTINLDDLIFSGKQGTETPVPLRGSPAQSQPDIGAVKQGAPAYDPVSESGPLTAKEKQALEEYKQLYGLTRMQQAKREAQGEKPENLQHMTVQANQIKQRIETLERRQAESAQGQGGVKEDAPDFRLTPLSRREKKAKAQVEQESLFGAGEGLEVGNKPIIGREATMDEAPLFSKTAQEEEGAQGSLFEANPEYRAIVDKLPQKLQDLIYRKDAANEPKARQRSAGLIPEGQASQGRATVRNQDGPANVRSQAESLARPAPGEGGGIKTRLGLAQIIKSKGRLDFKGHDVSTKEALAELSQAFRDRNVETLRFIYAKDGKYLNHRAVTSRRPMIVAPFIDEAGRDRFIAEAKAEMEKFGATEWHLVHNHPSGKPTPSRQDRNLTRMLEKRIPGFQGHVVVDHTQYGYIAPATQAGEELFSMHPIANESLRDDSKDNPLNNHIVTNADHVAALGKAIQAPKGYLSVIYATSSAKGDSSRSVAVQEVPVKFAQSKDFAGYLRNSTRAFGGNSVFIYTDNQEGDVGYDLMELIKSGAIRDAVIGKDGYDQSLAEYVRTDDPAFHEQGEPIEHVRQQTHRVQEEAPRYDQAPPKEPPKPPKPPPKKAFLTPAPKFTVDAPTKMDDFRRLFQDQHIDTRQTVAAIERGIRALGDQALSLPDVLNPLHYISTMGGKQDAKVADFETHELHPLKEELAAHGKTVDDLNDYLMALTAKEANAHFKAMNPSDVQGDLFEEEWDNNALSGMSNEDAQAILDAADHTVMQPLADKVFAILKENRRLMVAYGDIKPETAAEWEEQNPMYIPRRREGFEDEGQEGGRPAGLAVVGPIVKTSLGSQRKVVDVVGNIAAQRHRVITRGERMAPILAMAALFAKYPNHSFVKLTKPLTLDYIDPATGLSETITEAQGHGEMKRIKDKSTGQVKWVRNAAGFFADHVVPFKVGGVQYGLVFNNRDERAKQMARALKAKDVPALSGIVATIASGTRYIAAVNTQYSPAFGPWNFMRDQFFAAMTLANTVLDGQQGKIFQQALKNVGKIYQLERAQSKKGELKDKDFAMRYERFRQAGGMTGWRNLYQTGKEHAQEIERMLHPTRFQQSWAGRGGQAIVAWVKDYNAAFEHATRLAVFEAATHSGIHTVKAGAMAKDVTVNFNRHGTLSTQIGAFYAFFNVSMQASERVLSTMFEPGQYGKLTSAGKKIVYGGTLLGALQAAGLAMMGFKEDEPPEFVKSRSFIIPAPGTDKGYIAIPMALGFNIFPNLGRLAAEAVIYGNPGDKVMKFAGAALGVIDPLGGGATPIQEMAPTLLDPLASIAENKDWTGRSVYREDFLPMKPTPGHTRANQNAGEWAIALSKGINYAFGGTEYTPGHWGNTTNVATSPPPEVFEFLMGFALGGPGRELTKLGRVGSALGQGETPELYNIPLAGRLIGVASGSTQDWSRWRDNMTALHRHDLELDGRKGQGAAIREYRAGHPLAKQINYGRHMESRLRKQLSQRRDLAKKEDTPMVRLQRRRLDERISKTLTSFNERMEAVQANE